MTVACPAPEWPAELLEAGPPEDRSILLHGAVAIGGVPFTLTAVRVDPIRFGPDFLADLNSSVYADYGLSELLDGLSALVEVAEASRLQIGSGNYLLWMLPSGGAQL